jgi:large subunit ribosomal protein L7/L12
MADLKQFAEQLVNLTVKEVNELAILKDEYGIEPAAATVVVSGAGDGAAEEVQTELQLY